MGDRDRVLSNDESLAGSSSQGDLEGRTPTTIFELPPPSSAAGGMRVANSAKNLTEIGPDSLGARYPSRWSFRHVVTLVQKPRIGAEVLKAVLGELASNSVNVVRLERLSAQELAALQIPVCLPDGLEEPIKLKEDLQKVSKMHGADVGFQADDIARWSRRLIVFDMDSTQTQQEVIDEMAKIAGVEDEVKEIT